jgi:hypothetical protein
LELRYLYIEAEPLAKVGLLSYTGRT